MSRSQPTAEQIQQLQNLPLDILGWTIGDYAIHQKYGKDSPPEYWAKDSERKNEISKLLENDKKSEWQQPQPHIYHRIFIHEEAKLCLKTDCSFNEILFARICMAYRDQFPDILPQIHYIHHAPYRKAITIMDTCIDLEQDCRNKIHSTFQNLENLDLNYSLEDVLLRWLKAKRPHLGQQAAELKKLWEEIQEHLENIAPDEQPLVDCHAGNILQDNKGNPQLIDLLF